MLSEELRILDEDAAEAREEAEEARLAALAAERARHDAAIAELDLLLTGGRLNSHSRAVIAARYNSILTLGSGTSENAASEALKRAQELFLFSAEFHAKVHCDPKPALPKSCDPTSFLLGALLDRSRLSSPVFVSSIRAMATSPFLVALPRIEPFDRLLCERLSSVTVVIATSERASSRPLPT